MRCFVGWDSGRGPSFGAPAAILVIGVVDLRGVCISCQGGRLRSWSRLGSVGLCLWFGSLVRLPSFLVLVPVIGCLPSSAAFVAERGASWEALLSSYMGLLGISSYVFDSKAFVLGCNPLV